MAGCNVEKTVRELADKIPHEYTLSFDELMALHNASRADICHALIMAYTFGFCRGTRAYRKNKVPVLWRHH